jgi:hypothetical protein
VNPTGTVYLQANPNYVWADGDVYEIPQTDTIEAAAGGASFSGLGVVNQPHQLLLNKLGWLKRQSVQATSKVGASGWYKFADQDNNLGLITPIVQWGSIVQSGPISETGLGPGSGTFHTVFTAAFPIAFSAAVWSLDLSFSVNPIFHNVFSPFSGDPFGGTDTWDYVLWPPNLTQLQIVLYGEDWDTYYGTFFWRAVGY